MVLGLFMDGHALRFHAEYGVYVFDRLYFLILLLLCIHSDFRLSIAHSISTTLVRYTIYEILASDLNATE